MISHDPSSSGQVPGATRAGVQRRATRRRLALWTLLAALVWFAPLNAPHLLNPDEGRYAEIPREMLASGNWVTPRLDGIKYFEKPVLQYWTTAVAFVLFGQHAWSARLWPALTGFLGVLLTFWLADRVFDRRTALLAALIQASALIYLALARIATLDMSLTFLLQLAMTGLVLLTCDAPGAPERSDSARRGPAARAGPWLLAVGAALALLTKGLIGLAIPGMVALLYMLVMRDWTLPWRARPWWSVLAIALLAAPWFVLVSVRNPGYAHYFFIYQHFDRFLSPAGFNRYQPPWFFIPVLLLGFLPWTTLLPRVLIDSTRAALAGHRATVMLAIWAAFVFVFFSTSQSKLIPYVLPMIPALALLTARTLAGLRGPHFRRHLQLIAGFGAGLAALILLLWRLPAAARLAARAPEASVLAFAAAFFALALGAALGARLAGRGRVLAAAAAVALSMPVLAELTLLGVEQLPRQRDQVELVARLRPLLTPGTHLYCVQLYLQPLPFYLRRTCTPVAYRGELNYGLTQQPSLWIATLPQFAVRWRAEHDAIAVMAPQDLARLRSLGAPMRVIYTARSFVAVIRR